MNIELRNKLYDWLKLNSIEFNFTTSQVDRMMDYLNDYIPQAEKDNNPVWLEYFMEMNFGKENVKRLIDYWDYKFLKEKIRFREKGIFDDIIFNSILECAKREIHISSITFVDDNFFYLRDVLEKGFESAIISTINEFQKE